MSEKLNLYVVRVAKVSASWSMEHSKALQYVAAAFGILGATLLALPHAPGWGFGAFLVSNVGWMLFSYQRKLWGQFAQMSCFLVTSVVGLWNWWLGPLILG